MDISQQNITSELQFADNPRKISASQREQLSMHLKKFGDLGGGMSNCETLSKC